MGIPLQIIPYYQNGGGLNLKFSPTKTPDDEATSCLNVDYSVDGAFFTRNGSTIINATAGVPNQMAGAPKTLNISQYKNSIGTTVNLITAGTAIKRSLTSPVDTVTGISSSHPYPDTENYTTLDDEYLIWGNGVDSNLKFNGTTWTNLSFPRPSAPSFIADGVGVLPADTYNYYVTFARTVSGVIVQESQLSPLASHVLAAPASINLVIPVCSESLLTGVVSQCNARVLYRQNNTTGDIVRVTGGNGVTLPDNSTTAYNDNTVDADLPNPPVFADFNVETTPNSKVFEEYLGRMFFVDSSRATDVYYTKSPHPWNVVVDPILFDGPVRSIKRIFGALIFGTDRSLWVLNGDIATTSPRRVSSQTGIMNNRCSVGDDNGNLFIFATNGKMFQLSPTDFSQSEIRFSDAISLKIDPLMAKINPVDPELYCMELYTAPQVAKVILSVPIGTSYNNTLIIYNQSQVSILGKPVWQIWDNINASYLAQLSISNIINLYSGDYNGFIWKLDDNTTNGDGAEENGIVTASTNVTITDSTKTWTPNIFVGKVVRVISGAGVNQWGTITGNTSDTVTFSPAMSTALNSASEYTIGGYDVYQYSNWKAVVTGYDFLKQLWYIWVNANSAGDYKIKLILQLDFDQTISNQKELLLSLASAGAIWGAFDWGDAIWGAFDVFEDRLKKYGKFRAIRVAFLNRKAGQPFQINGFSLSVQDRQLFFTQKA